MSTVHPRLQMWHLMNETRVAMVTFRNLAGHMQAQPMTLFNKEIPRSVFNEPQLEAQHCLYFLVAANSALADAIAAEHHELSVTFGKHSADLYAFIQGVGQLSNDSKLKEELWTPTAEAWFAGFNDPNLRVLLVNAEHADVWHNSHGKAQQWWHLTKKAVGAAEDNASVGQKDHLQL